MTSSHSSKDPLRPLSQGESQLQQKTLRKPIVPLRQGRSDGGGGCFPHRISLLLHFSLSLRLAFAFSVVRSERLLQRQRGLHWDSAFFATFA